MSHMTTCRACLSERLYVFLEMGDHPPANQFVPPDHLQKPQPAFPLNAHVCLDCALIQVPDQLPADFFRHYVYIPSASDTMHQHFGALAQALIGRFLDRSDDYVVDIGCNDGLFLEACKTAGTRTLGIDPAENIAELARQKGLQVVSEYFSPDLAKTVRATHGAARIIVTTNTFNHIDDLHAFMRGVTILLQDDGVFVIEVPQALDLVQKNEFDTIYHEHLSEFSVKSLVDLFHFFDMEVFDLERLAVHGGSMRVFGQRAGTGNASSAIVEQALESERQGHLFQQKTYDDLAARVRQNRERLMTMLRELKAAGHRLAGYGAPAKGTTLLNYYGIGPDLLDFLADRNPLKQGLYAPGVHIPVVPPERIEQDKPDYLLILAWNFADEILQQQEAHRTRGGKFIIPIPEPQIIA